MPSSPAAPSLALAHAGPRLIAHACMHGWVACMHGAPQAGKSNESAQVERLFLTGSYNDDKEAPGTCNLARGAALRALPGHWRQTRNVLLPLLYPIPYPAGGGNPNERVNGVHASLRLVCSSNCPSGRARLCCAGPHSRGTLHSRHTRSSRPRTSTATPDSSGIGAGLACQRRSPALVCWLWATRP